MDQQDSSAEIIENTETPPAKRGRGRPKKIVVPSDSSTEIRPKRGRGRSPKPRAPIDESEQEKKAAGSVKRGRGRPKSLKPKKAAVISGHFSKRGRGRPKKNAQSLQLEPAETSDYNKYDYLFENASNKREKEESEVEMNFSDTSDDENMDEVNCDADGNAWNTKVAATTTTVLPSEITQMQSLWAKIVENTSEKMLGEYKTNLKGILIGRKSCLTPIGDLVPGFPADLLPTHDQLYTLLCQSSGAFPFKNHQGSKLVSRLWLADKSQIGAHLLLECLSQNVLAFDVLSDSEICESIQTYVRIGMKDLLGDSFHKQKDGTTSMDFPDSLVERLLKVD